MNTVLGAAARRYVLGGAWRWYVLAVATGIVATLTSCDPCAGTDACSNYPELSYSGQFFEHATGQPVGNVTVAFVRESGVPMPADTLFALADEKGFFKLTGPVYGVGDVNGHLVVKPPAPFVQFEVPNITVRSSTHTGDGVFAGRIVVDPYHNFVVEVQDRRFGRMVPNAYVRLKRIGGALVEPDSSEMHTDSDGRSFQELKIIGTGNAIMEVSINIPDVVDTYRFPFTLRPDYVERMPYVTRLVVPRVINYLVEFSRRGTGEFLPGVTLYVNHLDGPKFKPFEFTVPLDSRGQAVLTPEALGDGEISVEMIITPPPPLLPETLTNVRFETHYDEHLRFLLIGGYGPGMFFRTKLLERATGLPVKAGTHGVVVRTGGLPLVYPGGALTTADSGIREVDALGRLPFTAGTMDTGNVVFQATIRLAGFTPEVVPNLVVKARRDSTITELGPFKVGGWFPWYAEVREQGGGPLIAGAKVTFVRTSGIATAKDTLITVSDAAGVFRLNPVPLTSGSLTGSLRISFDSVYRDTVIAPVTITTTQNDTLKLLATYPIARRP